jgi:hypothetical protein
MRMLVSICKCKYGYFLSEIAANLTAWGSVAPGPAPGYLLNSQGIHKKISQVVLVREMKNIIIQLVITKRVLPVAFL